MVIKHLIKNILKREVKGVRVYRYLRGISLFWDFLHLSNLDIFPNREEYYEIVTRISSFSLVSFCKFFGKYTILCPQCYLHCFNSLAALLCELYQISSFLLVVSRLYFYFFGNCTILKKRNAIASLMTNFRIGRKHYTYIY